jgi:anaerobic selenocysteine-containing dehydrogenase
MPRQTDLYNPPLQVVGFVGTRRGDEERGPAVSLNREEASLRLLADGELVFIHGPRRKELAPVIVDNEVPRGGVVVRDIAGETGYGSWAVAGPHRTAGITQR